MFGAAHSILFFSEEASTPERSESPRSSRPRWCGGGRGFGVLAGHPQRECNNILGEMPKSFRKPLMKISYLHSALRNPCLREAPPAKVLVRRAGAPAKA